MTCSGGCSVEALIINAGLTGLMSQKRHQPATRYCVNCGLSVGQCRDLFFSRCCRLSSSRGWTMAIRHSLAFHHISCHDCSAYIFLIKVPAHHSSLSSGFRADCIQTCSPRVQVSTRVHTLLTSFVRWQILRLVSDSIPLHLHH